MDRKDILFRTDAADFDLHIDIYEHCGSRAEIKGIDTGCQTHSDF